MANQIVVSAGAKVRNLNGVLTGTSGVVSSVPLGAANGVATLDSGGKVPVSQLPSSVVTYLGTWNAATNTPTLVNGTGDAGDMYICNVAGTVNFGAGPVTFAVGDWVLYGSGTWQKSNGQNGTVTSVAVTESGDSLNITGSPITTSGTINIGFNGTNLQYVNGAGNLTTFPTLTGYVPYTGATQDVDLGAFKLNAQSLHAKGTAGNGHLGLKHQSASATASANEVSLFADTLGDLSWLNGNLYLSKFITSGNTAARSYTFPNASGTISLTSDLANYVDLTSNQTIGGTKTFTDATKNNGGIFLQNASSSSLAGYMNIGGLTNGVKFTSGGGVSNTFTLPSATGYTFTFPAATGTIALTSDLTGYVTSVTATTPLSSSGGTTPNITISQATTSTNGYLSSTDWNTFNGKQAQLNGTGFVKASGTTISYDNSTYLTTSAAASTYLPLTGGTLTGNLSFSQPYGLLYANGQYIKDNGSGGLVIYSGAAVNITSTLLTNNSNTVLDSSNYSSYALPLTGGTLTGALNINLSSGTALNVAGNAIFRGDTGVGTPRQLIITSGGSTPVYLEAKGYGANYQTDFGIRTYNSVGTAFEVFYATSSGNVGINQVSPSYLLDVNGTFRATGAATFSSSVTATEGKFSLDGGTEPTYTTGTAGKFIRSASGIYGGVRVALVGGASGGDNGFDFYNTTTLVGQFGYGAGGQQFYFTKGVNMATTSGNVGIGTSSPTDFGSSYTVLDVYNATVGGYLLARSPNVTGQISVDNNTAMYVQTRTNHPIAFVTNNAEKARITSDGNLLLGTTDNGSGAKLVFYSTSAAQQLKAAGTAPAITFSNTITSPTIGGVLGAATGANQFITGTAAGDMVLANQFNTGALIFGTSNTERMRILSTGFIYFGALPSVLTYMKYNFNVGTNLNIGFKENSGYASLEAMNDGVSANIPIQLVGTSYILNGLGTGSVTATSGVLSAVSDMNLKIEDGFINNALEKVMNLKPRYYHWKKESGLPTDLRQLGFYAQEVNQALGEEAANTPKTEKDKWGIYDRGMIAFLTAAIQEQQKQIEELKLKIK